MKSKLIFVLLILLEISCATPTSSRRNYAARMSSAEQCKALGEKREKLSRHQGIAGKTTVWAFNRAKKKEINSVEKRLLAKADAVIFSESDEKLLRRPVVESNDSTAMLHGQLVSVPRAQSLLEPILAIREVENVNKEPSDLRKQAAIQDEIEYVNDATLLIGFSALLGIVLLTLGQEHAKQMSRWAAVNPWKSRAIIGASQFVAGAGALAMGHYLFEQGQMIPEFTRYGALAGITASILFYPDVHSKMTWSQSTYLHQKIHDVSIFACGAVLMSFIGNHYSISQETVIPEYQQVYSVVDVSRQNAVITLVKNPAPVQIIQQDAVKKEGNGGKIVLTVLAALGCTALALVIAGLACEISCAGSGVGAAVLFLGGETALGFFCAWLMRKIWGIERKKKRVRPAH